MHRTNRKNSETPIEESFMLIYVEKFSIIINNVKFPNVPPTYHEFQNYFYTHTQCFESTISLIKSMHNNVTLV
jgi:hypothetical protein